VSFILPDNVENLILTGTSSVNATGNLLPNALTGNTGANILDGGQGADTMIGLAGNDTYFVDDAGDQAVELAAAGSDTVKSVVALTLFDNVENLILLGTDNIDGTGNGLNNNSITGNAGNNRLDGGFGNDTMIGGLGDDTYVVDDTGDKITEVFNAGTDTVEATVSFTLATYVENLTLTGANPINGTGSSAANVITGNDAANILDGRAGADTLFGGDGDDTFILDNAGDAVTEDLTHGTDTIKSSVAHALEGNVENLTLTGSGAMSATGNDLDNALTGNNAANVLDGGLGADKMSGLSGNDTYIVDNLGDVVIEISAAGGTDTVEASVSHTLGLNVEKLILTGADPIDGIGNTRANTLTGNDAANKLIGLAGNDTLQGGKGGDTLTGGVGSDILTGGEDADIFHFDALAEKSDTITDFLSGTDHIEIVAAGFTGAVVGAVNLASNATPAPTTAAGWFLFDTDNGRLSWDDDGTGAHAAQLLATLTSLPHVLTGADLLVV
jgi:Ca2+-binding RTX toxin-like protein